MTGLNTTTKSTDLHRINDSTESGQRIEEKGMKNRMSKLIYGLLVPAIVALMAIACNASAVWGS